MFIVKNQKDYIFMYDLAKKYTFLLIFLREKKF